MKWLFITGMQLFSGSADFLFFLKYPSAIEYCKTLAISSFFAITKLHACYKRAHQICGHWKKLLHKLLFGLSNSGVAIKSGMAICQFTAKLYIQT